MVQVLIWLCGAQWLLGLAGMAVAKGVFELEQGARVFDAFSGLWVAGGAGFCLLGTAALLLRTDREPVPAHAKVR